VASIREHVKKNGSLTYYVLWRDPSTRKQTSLPFSDLEKAEALRDLLNAHGQSLAAVEESLAKSAPRDVPTIDSIFEAHLERLTKPNDATISDYRRLYRNRIGKHREMTIEEFTEDVAAAWVKDLLKTHSRKTVANTTGLMSSVFKTAVRRGVAPLNPFEFIELPGETRTGRRATFLTKREYDLILSHLHPHYKLFVEADVQTGLRFAEITALDGGDLRILEEIPRIIVDKAWKEGGDGAARYRGSPKSDTSIRDVSIPLELAIQLQEAAKRKGLAFTAPRGGTILNKVFHRGWKKAIDAAKEEGLKKTPRFHDLRHTHASWLLQEGVPLFVVSRRLGHASPDITSRLYGHLTPEGHRQAVAGLEKALGRS